MIKGIGVDTVYIPDIEKQFALGKRHLSHIFTERELAHAKEQAQPAEYLATRFAVKEAVFKAIAHLLPERRFDLRIVETDNHEDGCPFVCIHDGFAPIMERAGIFCIHVSITTEKDYATAFVIAE